MIIEEQDDIIKSLIFEESKHVHNEESILESSEPIKMISSSSTWVQDDVPFEVSALNAIDRVQKSNLKKRPQRIRADSDVVEQIVIDDGIVR